MGVALKNSTTLGTRQENKQLTGMAAVPPMIMKLCCHARSPHPNPLPQAGEGANVSLREFHVNGLIRLLLEYPHK